MVHWVRRQGAAALSNGSNPRIHFYFLHFIITTSNFEDNFFLIFQSVFQEKKLTFVSTSFFFIILKNSKMKRNCLSRPNSLKHASAVYATDRQMLKHQKVPSPKRSVTPKQNLLAKNCDARFTLSFPRAECFGNTESFPRQIFPGDKISSDTSVKFNTFRGYLLWYDSRKFLPGQMSSVDLNLLSAGFTFDP